VLSLLAGAFVTIDLFGGGQYRSSLIVLASRA